MLEDYTLITTKVVTLWAVLDPIGHLPLFLGATAELGSKAQREAAIFAVLIAGLILSMAAISGQFILHAMGISLLSFQIAGGIIIFLFAVNMVLGAGARTTATADDPGRSARSIAVHPLATPIIAGPGAILTSVLLADNQRFDFTQQLTTLLALGTILLGMLGVFLAGTALGRWVGPSAFNAARRVMGLLLAALAVNTVVSALALWLHLPPI
jgi:multiple antibiotic resistance protein